VLASVRRWRATSALDTTPAAVDQGAYRARRLLRECIRSELRDTVATAQDHAGEVALMELRLLQAHPGMLAEPAGTASARDASPGPR
jgi:hypothetical protein